MADTRRLPRWYFGGLSSAFSVCITHPLDTLKVILQTQKSQKPSIAKICREVIEREGFVAFYNGLSASLLRQLTYSTTRFAIYDTVKLYVGQDTGVATKIVVALGAGGIGGLVGTPPDKVNVRMQNDIRLPKEKRVNYRHALHGLWMVYKVEGIKNLFTGASTASVRAALMAVGQLASYDQIKQSLLATPYFIDNVTTHVTASLGAGAIATTITQPLDVVKTRLMNTKPGQRKSIAEVILFTAKEGPLGFFKGYIPAFVRIGPQTILTFVFYERMRIHFGYLPQQ